jgi:hypothetical protein
MSYLETSEQILEEIRGDSELVRKAFEILHDNDQLTPVGAGSKYWYFSVGSFDSLIHGRLFMGIKISKNALPEEDYGLASVYSQILVDKFGDKIKGELPLFYGLLVNKKGSPIATISQDFSEGGKYRVENDNELNPLLDKIFNDERHSLIKCGIWVNNQRKLVDFNHIHDIRAEYKRTYKELQDKLKETNLGKIYEPLSI